MAKIIFDTHGNERQLETVRYWIDNETTDIAYGGSKGCNREDVLVATKRGHIPIKNVIPGDIVLSINEKTCLPEWKSVLAAKKFSIDSDTRYHKIISFKTKSGHEVAVTPNHEIYVKGSWVPAGEFAERILGIHSRDEWSIHGVDARSNTIDASIWTERLLHFNSYEDKEGIFESSSSIISRGEKEKSSSSPISCFRFYPQPGKQANVSRRVRSQTKHDQGCSSAQELDPRLIIEVEFQLIQGCVYDLVVADNHNYCVTEANLIIHNSGKSFLGCSLIFGDAFIYPETSYFIARKTLADLRKFTMPSISEVLSNWKIPASSYHYNGQDNYYLLNNGSRVYLLDAKPIPSDPLFYRFGSMQMTRGWIEEAGEFEEAAKNNLAASIGRWKNDVYKLKGKLLQTCNPSKNYLYRDYYKPNKEGKLPPWRKFVQALPQDNKMLAEGYLESLYRTLSPNERKRLLEGEWEYDDDPTALIEYDRACDVFENRNIVGGFKCVTADIARLGGDRIVIIEWDGFRGKVSSYKRERLTVTTTAIESARLRTGCGKSDVIVDADGVGSGVEDFGGFKGFVNNSRAMSDPKAPLDAKGQRVVENYDNLKSQCGFRMAEVINNNDLYLQCDSEERELILQELEQVKQKELDSDMKKGLVPKDEVKKLLGRSPDFWDAILMRIFFTLKPAGLKIRHKTGNEIKYKQKPARRYTWK